MVDVKHSTTIGLKDCNILIFSVYNVRNGNGFFEAFR